MIWFYSALGLLISLMGIFYLSFCIVTMKKSECVIGTICEIDNGSPSQGGSAHHIIVQFNKDGETIRLHTLSCFFLAPFFEKCKLARLRKKHVGRQVHIYYNPARETQALLREYIWKNFLTGMLLIFLGCFPIFSIIIG